jgi:hypothetical protein
VTDPEPVECRYKAGRRVACVGPVIVRMIWPDGDEWYVCTAHYYPDRQTQARIEHLHPTDPEAPA